jgi:hypothetical protein
VPWALGGKTEVEGMSLLCVHHHSRLSRGWRLERLPDRKAIAQAPGAAVSIRTRAGPVPPLLSG